MMYVLKLTIIVMILHNLFVGKVNKDATVIIKPCKNILTKKQYFEKIRRLRRNGKPNTRNKR